MHRKGFTLIELLVVIAIIAILAAILFPVFAKAREKARQSSCLSNVKQLMLAFLQYAQDFDEMGMQRDTNAAVTPRYGWTDMVAAYVKNTQVFICPSTKVNATCFNTTIPTSYGYSFCEARNAAATIKHPSEFLVFVDWRGYAIKYHSAGGATCVDCPWNTRWRPGTDTIPHNDGVNVGLYDGHAKWMSISTINDTFRNDQLPWRNL